GILGASESDRTVLVDRLLARSEGNPLFVEELLAAGRDGRGELPPTLRDALMLRVEALSRDAQELLRVVAAGQRVDHEVLREAAGLESRALRDALREAEAALRGVRRFGGGAEIGRYAPQDPLQVLAAVPGRELERFAADQLAPLRELDAESAGVLLRTLEALLASGLNVAETARTGGWHYNTVRYRVRRLTELLGDFMEDGARCQSLALALLLRDARRGAWTPPARSTLSA
ncbi:MAG TPA: helix-turn-helix domain-containing protein, partial [Conexibacter sp.]|nr:helix-turn-helix domain-containing protein [Conexibacter sp.]